MRILVFGLPGSGKTTISKTLSEKVGCVLFNADEVRSKFNDWDFSDTGRERQLERMVSLSNSVQDLICDFVCPFEKGRERFNADVSIWMDTIQKGRFDDTNAAFQRPEKYDIRINTFEYDIVRKIREKQDE